MRSCFLAFTLMFFLQGCASKRSTTDRNRESQSALVLLEELPASGSVLASDAFPASPTSIEFKVLDDDGVPTGTVLLRTEDSDLHHAKLARSEGETRTEYLRIAEDGSLVSTAVLDRREQAISQFNPPLLLMPAEIPAGDQRRGEAAMRVMDSENSSKLRETGKAWRTIVYAADQRIRTPLGEFVAKRLEIEFKADLRLAEAHEQTTLFIVPEIGLIAQQSRETVKVLGAFSDTKRRTIVRNHQ
jgi:hypothetical protein